MPVLTRNQMTEGALRSLLDHVEGKLRRATELERGLLDGFNKIQGGLDRLISRAEQAVESADRIVADTSALRSEVDTHLDGLEERVRETEARLDESMTRIEERMSRFLLAAERVDGAVRQIKNLEGPARDIATQMAYAGQVSSATLPVLEESRGCLLKIRDDLDTLSRIVSRGDRVRARAGAERP